LEDGERVQAEVTEVNRGGVVVAFGRLRGFVPNSHLRRGRPRREEAKQELIGEVLSLAVLEVNQRRRRLVLSERVADARTRQQLLEELHEGQVRSGVVRNLTGYGAFVDLGGIDGLIHISELEHTFVKHPSEVLAVGDEIDVEVIHVDRQQERVGLSRKRLLPEAWERVTENLFAGDAIVGTVTAVVSFGAFVDVGAGVEGLLHVSEIPNGQPGLSELATGSSINVHVRRIDRERHRISLTMNHQPTSLSQP
jgi:small subunit ribosomal protein S1